MIEYFHRFPVELLHTLFDYFAAHELLHTFLHMSDYIDEVLGAYATHRVNCQSIQKADFDLICRYIRPNQVISLTLSDGNDTPGLSQLFLSYFRMEQFTRLRSLRLIEIENHSLRLISSCLHQFKELRSLSINTESIRSAQNLCINSHLRHFKLEKCTDDELETIWRRLPQLKSLDVYLDVNRSRLSLKIPTFDRLIRLNLQIENYHTSMDEIQRILKSLPNLKHFQLKTRGSRDLFDGDQWKLLTKTFHTFNFHLTAEFLLNETILQSFSTAFWLKEKHWFIAYEDSTLFTVPHFAPNHVNISQQLCTRTTAPDGTLLHDQINKMVIESVAVKPQRYYNHIETLELKYSASLKTIASMMNFRTIKHLSVLWFDDVLAFIPWEDSMPHLRQLTVENELTIDRIERVNHYRFEHIHRLEIGVNEKQSDRIIERLSTIFPSIQYLTYNSCVPSKDTAVYLINRFQQLMNVSFLVDVWSYRRDDHFFLSRNAIVQCSWKPGRGRFMRRIYGSRMADSSNDRLRFYYWIGEESCTHLQFIVWLLNVEYYWDQLKQTLSRFLIYLPLVIVISIMELIGGFEIAWFYQIRHWNIYVLLLSILFLSVTFTFTMISLPFLMKLFSDCINL